MFLVIWLLLIFVPEGLGIYLGRDLSRLFIIGFPVVGFLNDQITGKKVVVPIKISLVWLLYLLVYFASSIYSTNVTVSMQWLIYQISLFSCFIYFYNHQESKSAFFQIGIVISLVFCLYTSLIYLGLIFFKESLLPLPDNGYQFVYSKFGSHNHLGDWLVIFFLIVCFYIQKNKNILLYGLGSIFLSFIVGSYSRSAYLSLGSAIGIFCFWQRKKISTSKLKIIIAGIIILISLSFVVVKDIEPIPIFGQLHNYIKSKGNLSDKEITAKRLEFAHQSIEGIKAKPLNGYGPGNFLEVSTLYTSYGTRTHSAHNIFLDSLAEVGIPATLIFFLITVLIIWNQIKYPSLIGLIIAAFSTNSLTDYTYRIYSFMFLFIAFSGLSYHEKGVCMSKKQFIVMQLINGFLILYLLIIL